MIGIIFAMKEEIDSFLENVELIKENKIFDIIFYECNYKDKKLVLLESGIGKVNAARSCQLLIDNYDVKYIINIGVAGSISKDVEVLDIVVGEKLVQHDFDLVGFGHEKGYVPKVGVYVKSSDKLCKLIKKSKDVHFGVIASGDIFLTDNELAKKINSDFEALCVEMEGASIAQVSYLSNIPFVVIRCISDSVYCENNKMDYDEFLVKGCKKISKFLLNIIKEI